MKSIFLEHLLKVISGQAGPTCWSARTRYSASPLFLEVHFGKNHGSAKSLAANYRNAVRWGWGPPAVPTESRHPPDRRMPALSVEHRNHPTCLVRYGQVSRKNELDDDRLKT